MKFRFWKPKQELAIQVSVPEPRELTGIEKMELEQAKMREAAIAKEQEEWRASIHQEISAIEAQIAPQMRRLAELRGKLDPFGWSARAQMAAQSGQIFGPTAMSTSDLNSLLGGAFGALSGIGR